MITTEQLSANPALSALSDEQRAAITEMSRNDEATVISQKTSEIYNNLDKDIEASTGIKRNGDEKTFDYLKRSAGILKGRAETAGGKEQELANARTEIDRLKAQVAAGGGDAETAGKMAELQRKYDTLKADYDSVKSGIGEMQANHTKELHSLRVDTEIQSAMAGIKFDDAIAEGIRKVIVKNAIDEVKGITSEFIDDGKGGQRLAYRDANGVLMNNPENNLAPFTTAELLAARMKDIIKAERQQGGGGQTPPAGGSGGGTATDVSGAKTRMEAMSIITTNLLAKGLVKGTQQFQDALNKEYNTDAVKALPEK